MRKRDNTIYRRIIGVFPNGINKTWTVANLASANMVTRLKKGMYALRKSKGFALSGSLIVALGMALSACSNSSGSGSSDTQTKEGADKPAASAQTKKLQNADVTVESMWFMSPDGDGKNPGNPAIKAAVDEYEKQYGGKVTFKVVGWGDLHKNLAPAVASGDVWDLEYTEGFMDFPQYMADGLIQPVDKFVDLKNPLWSKQILDGVTYKGKVYGVNALASQMPYVLFYNKTLFKEQGVKDPGQYYAEGDWNYDNFVKAAKEMTKDTNGDGKTDQWGVNLPGIPTYVFASNGGEVATMNDDGTYTAVWNSKNNAAVMNMMQQLYHDNQSAESKSDNRGGTFVNRQYAMYDEGSGYALPTDGSSNGLYPNSKHNDEYGFVPFPAGPDMNGKYVSPFNDAYWAIPTGAKNPEGAGILATLISKHLQEDTIKQYKDYLKPDDFKIFQDILNNQVPQMRYRLIGLPKMGEIYADGKPVQATLDAEQKQLEAKVAEFNAKVKK